MDNKFLFKYNSATRVVYHSNNIVGQLSIAEGKILVALIKSDALITREQLLDIAWPAKNITPNSLNVAIKKIRSTFDIVTDSHVDVVVTHFKKGFSWNHQYVQCEMTDDNDLASPVSSKLDDVNINEEFIDMLLISESLNVPELVPDETTTSDHKNLTKPSRFSLHYSIVFVFFVLFIMVIILFYVTQIKLVSCHNIEGSEFCGYGKLTAADIPEHFPAGNYIYANSSVNGFRYVEVE